MSGPPSSGSAAPRLRGAGLVGRAWTLDRSTFRPPHIPDALTFHGWNRNGTYFAFERYVDARGADCSDYYALYAVDASQDRFLKGGRLEVRYDSPEGDAHEGCRPPSLGPVIRHRRTTFLKQHRIVPGRLTPPVEVRRDRRGPFFVLPDGRRVDVVFSVRHRTSDPYGEQLDRGAAYRLELRFPGGDSHVLEDGTRRRPGVMDYRLGHARVFVSPERTHLAFFVERIERDFEGGRGSWMANGWRLPVSISSP